MRIENIRNQVKLVNANILYAYEHNDKSHSFAKFLSEYYSLHPLYDQIRISSYYDKKLIYHTGRLIKPTEADSYTEDGIAVYSGQNKYRNDYRHRDNIYYDVIRSDDKRLEIYTILPFDDELIETTQTSTNVYLSLIFLAILCTIPAYITSKRLGRTIYLLRDFATRASNDCDFVPTADFSHDELGEISQQIVQLYNERHKAVVKLNREHQVAMHALEEKTQLKHEFTNNLNHQLKTPISIVKGYIDTLAEHPDMDKASRLRFLSKARENIDRLVQLINDISKLTRLEYGTRMIKTEPINFHEIVFQVASEYENSGLLGKMEFNYDIPTFCRVIGNAPMLHTVINNLTKNSVAYSEGTECNFILTGSDNDFYHFAFYDNGKGVNPDNLPLLFERFFREDSEPRQPIDGTGLGLPIVKNSIVALGGTVSANNREGGGLIIRFTLRRADKNSKT